MPEGYVPERPYPGKDKPYTLADAAAQEKLIKCRCGRCKRVVHYLASDLVAVKGPVREAINPPYACSKCGSAEWVRVDIVSPSPGDYGSLIVRRPSHVVTTQMWKSVKLGD
jgi:hypothetical protein